MNARDLKGKIDFGIITIREDEFAAVLKRFHPVDHAQGERVYGIAQFQATGVGSYVVSTVRCIEQGTGEAQNVANDLINDLDPTWILLVGIGGAVPASEFTLGDVIAATRLHDFCVEALVEDHSSEYSIAGGPMHKSVQAWLAHLTAMEDELAGWNTDVSIGVTRPKVAMTPDAFYGDRAWQDKVLKSISNHFGDGVKIRPPLVTAGAFASSDRLIKDSTVLREWQRTARHIQGIEMELAGVYRAARKNIGREYPILAIRGVSDIVGFRRDDAWLDYACNSAAAFSAALLKTTPIPPRSAPLVLSNRPYTARNEKNATSHAAIEDRYEIDHIIFAGHFSRVFKCRKRNTNDVCIVKETIAENVDLEALSTLKILNCPNVAAPREIWEYDGKIYEELPYIGGVRLSRAIIHGIGGLSGALLENFHERMMGILENLHTNGILHRDIHPDNIYLVLRRPDHPASFEAPSEIRLWETFGDSDPRLTTGLDYLDSKSTFEVAWVLVDCTFATSISEHQKLPYRHGPYTDENQERAMATPASDVYALGATIFYSITGRDIPNFKQRKAGNDITHFPGGSHPSTRFSRHLAQLLSLNPEKRPTTLADLGEDTHTNGYTGALRLSEKELLILDRFESQTRILNVEQARRFYHSLEERYRDLADSKDLEDRQRLSRVKSWIRFLSDLP